MKKITIPVQILKLNKHKRTCRKYFKFLLENREVLRLYYITHSRK